MRFWLFAIFCAAGTLAGAADWQERLTPPQPGAFPLPGPLEAKYRFGWGAISAAEGTFTFAQPQKGELELQVDIKSTGAVRAMWRLDARHTARCEAATLRPINLVQVEAYKDETLTTKADFTPEAVVRTQSSVPADAMPAKPKRFKCANLFDLHTAMLFVRSQPLRAGDVIRLVVYPATTPYLATIRVVGGDETKVAGKMYRAIKMSVELQRVTKDLRLVAHKKFKRATVWVSDDSDRLLLKIQSEVFVGSVWAELDSVKRLDARLRAERAE